MNPFSPPLGRRSGSLPTAMVVLGALAALFMGVLLLQELFTASDAVGAARQPVQASARVAPDTAKSAGSNEQLQEPGRPPSAQDPSDTRKATPAFEEPEQLSLNAHGG